MLALRPTRVPVASSARNAGSARLSKVVCHSNERRASAAAMLAAAAVISAVASPLASIASGLESITFPFGAADPSAANVEQRDKLAKEDADFQKSDTLKMLLERSETNRAKNKKEIQNKYCYRQAELGIGDCGGLSLIPGLTDNGKQTTPKWLNDLLGKETPAETAKSSMTLMELIEGNAK